MNLDTISVNAQDIKVKGVVTGNHDKKGPFQKLVWDQKRMKNHGTAENPVEIEELFTAEAKTFKMKPVKIGDVFKAGSLSVRLYEMENGKTYYGIEPIQ